jgi:hypothetical protein
MRTITKLMMVRTVFDPTVPPTTDLYKTVKQIINVDAEKVVLHPSDGRRVLRALRHFIQDVDKERLTELFLRSRL